MLELLGILVPVFGLIALGYGARAVGLLGPRAGEGLSEFVFVLEPVAHVREQVTHESVVRRRHARYRSGMRESP